MKSSALLDRDFLKYTFKGDPAMKKTFIKRTFLILLVLIMTFTMAACIDPSEDGSDVKMITVKMNILYPDSSDSGADIPKDEKNYKISVEESATVIQILEAYSQQENIDISVDKSDTVYVTSIRR